jgi:hypothetical protein
MKQQAIFEEEVEKNPQNEMSIEAKNYFHKTAEEKFYIHERRRRRN